MNKEADLLKYMLTGRAITNWEATKMFRLLDFRKALTRIRKKYNVESIWCQRGKARYKQHRIAASTDSKRKCARG